MDVAQSKAFDRSIGPVACRHCDLFEVCSLIDAMPISSGLQRCPTLRTVARGEALYEAGAPAQYVYAIRKGVVKSLRPMPDSKKRIVALHVPGEVVGREAIAWSRYTHDVIAVTPVMVCELPIKPFLRSDPVLARVRSGFEQLGRAQGSDSARRNKGHTRERLDAFIGDLRARFRAHGLAAEECSFALRRRELAELLNVSSHSLGRIMEDMQPDGPIRARGHRVVLQNVA
ncbi:MAG: Crp/Fnr family transcriptional regulator [Xanthomonadaceae bacterium]|nr:Crp/Fnr family transcriptional regulator [Xanthomonadaceae bacterium]